ncbi:MAG: hypothetical protein ACRBC3_10510 [Burkholderiaceae bacterium]
MSQIQRTDDIPLTVRTADQTRKAAIEIDPDATGAKVIQTAADNWSLPANTDYALVNTTSGVMIAPNESLKDKVQPGDTLEIQPVLVAG